jgi:hypothetical protein
MTLLGIVEAATIKGVAETAIALIIVIVTGSVSIVIAHAWAQVIAHRVVDGRQFTRDEIVAEVWFAASFLISTAIALIAILVSLPIGDFGVTVQFTLVAMLGLLFVVGVTGALRSGATWVRALGWGLLDVGVGVLIVLLKDLLTLIGKL